MSTVQTNAIAIQRQVSLFEAFLFALATHAAILVILSLLGLLSLLTERAAERNPDRDVEVQFTVAPESPAEAPSEPTDAAAPSDLPPLPDGAPAQDQPEATEPDAQAPASLDRPQPMIAPTPGGESAPSQPGTSNDEPPLPADQLEEEGDSDEPSSDGLVEGLEQGTTQEAEIEAAETIDPSDLDPSADTLSSREAGVETELDMPETDDGTFASSQQPAAESPVEPPALGRPLGPSPDERLSDFSRAIERAHAVAPRQPSQAPRNVFEPDWSNLPPTGQVLGNMVFESGDYDWTDYQRQIYWIIWRTWHNRLLARVDDFEKWAQQNNTGFMEHINGVRFTIERNGEISSIVVETESNSVPFDLSAVEGLDEAVLPPLPDDFTRDREIVHAQFMGQGEIGMMRRGLRRLRDAGVF
jgi:hypothetical protein